VIRFSAYRHDQGGSSAAEFALLIPMVVMLVLGMLHLSLALYTAVNLHYAVEATARCLSVSANNPSTATTLCPNAAQVQAYGQSRYKGFYNISPQFTVVSPAVTCTNGNQVSGTGTYTIALGLLTVPIPITANACFPYLPYKP
jgi:Flp pilus assembly protein TadG